MMDLDPDAVGELFGDDRERDLQDVELSHWISIDRNGLGYVIECEGNEYSLSEHEAEQMLDDLEFDSIWRVIAERTKTLQWLRSEYDE